MMRFRGQISLVAPLPGPEPCVSSTDLSTTYKRNFPRLLRHFVRTNSNMAGPGRILQEGVGELTRYDPRALQSLVSQTPNATFLAAEGTVTIPSDYRGAGPLLVHGAPGSNIQFQDVSAQCSFCSERFDNQTLLDQHNWHAFKRCAVHRMCFDNWHNHNSSYEHTICGLDNCQYRGTEFYINSAYFDHFHEHHQNHCKSEEARIGRGFCQLCYWQHGYSHDATRSQCKARGK